MPLPFTSCPNTIQQNVHTLSNKLLRISGIRNERTPFSSIFMRYQLPGILNEIFFTHIVAIMSKFSNHKGISSKSTSAIRQAHFEIMSRRQQAGHGCSGFNSFVSNKQHSTYPFYIHQIILRSSVLIIIETKQQITSMLITLAKL